MILYMKYKSPVVGSLTVRTDFFMVTKEKESYKVVYQEGKGYRAVYNVASFEVLFNE